MVMWTLADGTMYVVHPARHEGRIVYRVWRRDPRGGERVCFLDLPAPPVSTPASPAR